MRVPRPPSAPTWLRERPIAHRGLHDQARPENSIAAIEAAVAAGYAIEIDVHRTYDGKVVVFHDDELQRMTGAHGRVEDHRAAELVALRLAGSDEHVPLLDQVLEAVGGRVPLLVELKGRGGADRLAPTLDLLGDYVGEVAVQSFDPRSMAWFRRAAPDIPRGMLCSDFAGEALPAHEKLLLRHLLLAPWVVPHFVGYDLRCLPCWPADLARRVGLPLLAWTVRTAEQADEARRVADNLIFEGIRP